MSTTASKLPTRRAPACSGVSVTDEGQAIVLHPVSAQDPEAMPEDELAWRVHRQPKPVVVDLRGIEQFNSDCARWLMLLTNLLPSKRLHLRNATPSVRAGMRLLGFDRLVDTGQ